MRATPTIVVAGAVTLRRAVQAPVSKVRAAAGQGGSGHDRRVGRDGHPEPPQQGVGPRMNQLGCRGSQTTRATQSPSLPNVLNPLFVLDVRLAEFVSGQITSFVGKQRVQPTR